MGLKMGMYSSAGKFTCGGYPGSLGYETQDAQYWAGLGADYVKYDNCYNEGLSGTPKLSQDRYAAMSNALNSTGRNITYSLCNWVGAYSCDNTATLLSDWVHPKLILSHRATINLGSGPVPSQIQLECQEISLILSTCLQLLVLAGQTSTTATCPDTLAA